MRIFQVVLITLILSVAVPASAFDVLTPESEYDGYCPQISLGMGKGATDTYYYGQVSELQKFLAEYFEVAKSEIVSGTFGDTTELYVKRFQTQNGLEAVGRVGTQTLQKIWELCPNQSKELPKSPMTPAPTPRVSNGSCSLTSDVTSADDKERFITSWKISKMDAPILWREGYHLKAVTVPTDTAEAWKQWLVGTDLPAPTEIPRIETFHIGEKTTDGSIPVPLCSVSVSIAFDRIRVPSSPTLPRSGGLVPSLVLLITPSTVPLGDAASLSWTVANAPATSTRCFLEYKDKKLELKSAGARTIRPTENTTYKMTCLNTVNGLNATRSTNVTVGPPRPRVVTGTPTTGGGGGYEGAFGTGLGGGIGGFGGWVTGVGQSAFDVMNNFFQNTCWSITGCAGGTTRGI